MESKLIGKHVIVRSDRAGVFFGVLEEVNGKNVSMKNVRKTHYWDGAAAVEEMCIIGTKKPNQCRFTKVVEYIEIADWIQILPCTEEATKVLKEVPEWTA